MANVNLIFHRIRQFNAGTGMRPEWKHVEQPAKITCSIPRMYERDSAQLVHFLESSYSQCPACGNAGPTPVWTDDVELWERHPARCNYAYQP